MTNDEINSTRFLNIGTSNIYHELFCPPSAFKNKNYQSPDGYQETSFKSTGGFWLTKDTGAVNSNEWLFYISIKENLLHQKFSRRAVSVKLNNANIFIPSTMEELLELQEKYPIQYDRNNSPHNLINYHELAKDYDGIYLSHTLVENPRLSDWNVRTLILFNLNCIDSYHSKKIDYYKEGYYAYYFEEVSRSEEKRIPPINPKYIELFNEFNKLYQKVIENKLNNISINNYREFLEESRNSYMKLLDNNQNLYNNIKEVLQNTAQDLPLNDCTIQVTLESQLRDKNYETISDIYQKALRK